MKTLIMRTDSYRIFLLIFLGLLTAFGPFVTDMYLPALPSMVDLFGTNTSMVQLSLTSCMIGLAAGQLLFGPMSDRYGRKPVLLWTLLLFILSTLLCLFSADIYLFVIFRLFQGIAAAGSIVIARSISTDLFSGHELARILAIVGSINGIAPVLAPVLGGAMAEAGGWESIFAVLLFIGMLLLFACLYYQESMPVERRVSSGLLRLPSYFIPLLGNRPYMGYMLQLGFAQAALFANIASAPFIMQQYYGFTPLEFSMCFGMNALAVVISAALAPRFRRIEKGTLLGSAGLLVFSVCEAAALFAGCSFPVYEGFMLGILFSLGLCFTSSTTLAMAKGAFGKRFRPVGSRLVRIRRACLTAGWNRKSATDYGNRICGVRCVLSRLCVYGRRETDQTYTLIRQIIYILLSMNRLFVMMAILLAGMSAYAQSEKRIYTKAEQKSAEERELQERMEAVMDSVNYADAVKALEELDFVLEADRIVFKRGEMAFVTSNTNFISLSDDKAVVQIAPFNGGGPNGVGGITVEGRASNIRMKTDKKGNITFSMSVMGTGISATVDLSLPKGTNRASVTVNPNLNSNRITLDGRLLPKERSSVFKGTSF